MKAILVQPPFVQLNAPYPAVHYLEAFLKAQGHDARSFDHSIALYRAIFSRPGLAKVFADVEAGIAAGRILPKAREAAELERYLSYKDLYLECIEGIVDFLSGGDPGFAHRLSAAAEFPRGSRAAALVEAAGGRLGPEEARGLATRILEDLGDLIAYALDPDFATVRYGDRLARSQGDFSEVLSALDSAWFLKEIYGPWLTTFWSVQAAEAPAGEDVLLLVTIPFPGCLTGALACARAAKAALGSRARIALGGGYVSTELRNLEDSRIFDFCEWLSFDAGYGSLASILVRLGAGTARDIHQIPGLYRTMLREAEGGVRAEGFPGSGESTADGARFAAIEREALETVFPDYASADFSAYLAAVDSGNPMHRLWSDTPWLKFSLAHGCYWQRCAFCDTQLDYVKNFVPARLGPLLAAMASASKRHGLYGIHFVDEALPMRDLLAFGDANRARAARGGRPYHYWGNVRFDPSWTEDRSAYLAACGLVAVSGGIEIATEAGLAMTDKGFDLAGLVKTLVGMRRAGLLVHAYLIYGFPGQAPGDILDSAEVVRQLFSTGLIDSGFWHRFVLTRGSRMMEDYAQGRMPGLQPIDREGSFADNDLEFQGEAAFDPWDGPLVAALDAWMAGNELDLPAPALLARLGLQRPPRATIAPGLLEALIDRAEGELDAWKPEPTRRARWVGGLPRLSPGGTGKKTRLAWVFRGETVELRLEPEGARRLASALASLASGAGETSYGDFLEAAGLKADSPEARALRGAGLLAL